MSVFLPPFSFPLSLASTCWSWEVALSKFVRAAFTPLSVFDLLSLLSCALVGLWCSDFSQKQNLKLHLQIIHINLDKKGFSSFLATLRKMLGQCSNQSIDILSENGMLSLVLLSYIKILMWGIIFYVELWKLNDPIDTHGPLGLFRATGNWLKLLSLFLSVSVTEPSLLNFFKVWELKA